MAHSPLDISTMGFLNSPLSVSTLGFITIQAPVVLPEEPTGQPNAPMGTYVGAEEIRERWERIMREERIKREDEDFIVIAVAAIKLLLGKL